VAEIVLPEEKHLWHGPMKIFLKNVTVPTAGDPDAPFAVFQIHLAAISLNPALFQGAIL
jgi:hypothetical protein